jgi:hypothetical protein
MSRGGAGESAEQDAGERNTGYVAHGTLQVEVCPPGATPGSARGLLR